MNITPQPVVTPQSPYCWPLAEAGDFVCLRDEMHNTVTVMNSSITNKKLKLKKPILMRINRECLRNVKVHTGATPVGEMHNHQCLSSPVNFDAVCLALRNCRHYSLQHKNIGLF